MTRWEEKESQCQVGSNSQVTGRVIHFPESNVGGSFHDKRHQACRKRQINCTILKTVSLKLPIRD